MQQARSGLGLGPVCGVYRCLGNLAPPSGGPAASLQLLVRARCRAGSRKSSGCERGFATRSRRRSRPLLMAQAAARGRVACASTWPWLRATWVEGLEPHPRRPAPPPVMRCDDHQLRSTCAAMTLRAAAPSLPLPNCDLATPCTQSSRRDDRCGNMAQRSMSRVIWVPMVHPLSFRAPRRVGVQRHALCWHARAAR